LGLEPDLTAIRAHLERLFRRARLEYPEGRCEIAFSNAKGAVNAAETFALDPDSLDAATVAAARYNNAGSNVYVGVNPRKPSAPPFGRASADDVEIAFVQFIDGDSLDTVAKLRNPPAPYTWAVTTGKIPNPRVQPYWDLEEPTRNMEAWSRQQLALAEFYGADHVIDPPRIMRLAGTISYPSPKKIARGYITEPVTIRTLYSGEERPPVSFEALAQAYPPVQTNGHTFYTNGHDNRHDPETGEVFEESPGTTDQTTRPNFQTDRRSIKSLIEHMIADKGGWHAAALTLTGHMINRGDPDALILALAPALTTSGYTVAETHAELSQMIRSGRDKWGIPNRDEDFSAGDTSPRTLPLEWFTDIQPSLNASDFIEGLLCDAGMSVVYGESNCGKTFFMTDIAYHIAAGRPWCKREIEQGGVIYVALEGGFGIRNRLAALRQHYNETTAIPFAIVPCSVNLLDADADTAPLIELIKQAAEQISVPVRLVVIDTLSRAMNGGNENAPEDMGKIVKSADHIREQTGAHVAFVHHCGKDQARGARGHSSLRAATDTEIEITRTEGSTFSTATVTKQRELEIDGEFVFELKQVSLGTNKRGKEVTSCVVVEAQAVPDEAGKQVRLSDMERGFLTEILELFNRGDSVELVEPEAGMPTLRTLKRDTLRNWLIKRGKLDVTVEGNGDRYAMSGAEKQRLYRVLNALVNKGVIAMNQERLWLLR
jgi:RecA-family ATPase